MNLEMEYETVCTPWRSYIALSGDIIKGVFPSSHLDPYGFRMIVDMRSSLRDLQRYAFHLFMRGQPPTAAVGSANTLKRGTLVAIQDVPKAHKVMHKFPCPNISKTFMEDFGDLFSYGPGSNIVAE